MITIYLLILLMTPTVVVFHNVSLEQYLLSESVLKIPFLGCFGQMFRLHLRFLGVWNSPVAWVWGFGFKVRFGLLVVKPFFGLELRSCLVP